jgi:hypothetical protein
MTSEILFELKVAAAWRMATLARQTVCGEFDGADAQTRQRLTDTFVLLIHLDPVFLRAIERLNHE